MLLFILAIIFAIIAIAFLVKGKVSDGSGTLHIRWVAAPFLILAVIFFGVSLLHVVDPGEVAVPITFGSTGEPVGSGTHLMMPWVGLTGVNVRTVEYTMAGASGEGNKQSDDSIGVKGRDGATGQVDLTVLYHVNEADAGRLYKETGTDFEGKIVRTNARTCTRDGFATTDMVAASTTERAKVEQAVTDCIRQTIEPRGITVESVQIRNIGVEKAVQDAINAKVASQQNAAQKEFELAAARQDAEKSNIEKKAVSDGQQIIKCGGKLTPQDNGQPPLIVPNTGAACENQLTPEYLEWAYIDMMRSIANSPNHDTIVIPAPTASSQPQIQVQVPTK